MNKEIKVIKTSSSDLALPFYATSGSAGMDLFSSIDENITLKYMDRAIVPTSIFIELPEGFEVTIRSRSGMAANHGVIVLNSPGTIDSDYRGEIKVILINLGKEDFIIKRGMKIAQMVFSKYEKVSLKVVDSFDVETVRGDGGFGSTGF